MKVKRRKERFFKTKLQLKPKIKSLKMMKTCLAKLVNKPRNKKISCSGKYTEYMKRLPRLMGTGRTKLRRMLRVLLNGPSTRKCLYICS